MFTDSFKQYARHNFEFRKAIIPANAAARMDELDGDILYAMLYLYGTLPRYDIQNVSFDTFYEEAELALKTYNDDAWRQRIPQDIFAHFVLCPRVNNEKLESCRLFFHSQLIERVSGLSMEQAVLEANLWCCEHVTYQASDERTEGPMTAYLSAKGRCGEESVFAVTALRSIGIPARQVYAPWWSHCDDNHAWVEAYVDGCWRFIGACEAETVLDRGWFMAASRRAMLVHARAFSAYGLDNEVIIEKRNDAYLLNETFRYADTVRLDIHIKSGAKAAANARVHIQVLNMATYRDIAVLTSDAAGRASITIGKGSVHIFVEHGGRYGSIDVDTEKQRSVTVELCGALTGFISGVFRAPAPVAGAAAHTSKADESRKRSMLLEAANKRARHARLAYDDFIKRGNHKKEWLPILEKSCGNIAETGAFLLEHSDDSEHLAIKLLESLAEKDLRDTKAGVLEYHLKRAMPYYAGFKYAESVFVDNILCPRIGVKPISIWNDFNKLGFSVEEAAVARLRLSGVPARLDPVTGKAQYLLDSGWSYVENIKTAPISILSEHDLSCFENWSLSMLKNSSYAPLGCIELPFCGRLPIGRYLLIATNRLPNGNQHFNAYCFELNENDGFSISVSLPNIELKDMLQRIPLDDARLYALDDTARDISSLCRAEAVLLAFLRPANEPTEHFINELYEKYADIAKRCRVLLILPDKAANDPTLARFLARWQDAEILLDKDDVQAKLARETFNEPNDYPLLFIVSKNRECRFCTTGYSVGGVELISRLIGKMLKRQR